MTAMIIATKGHMVTKIISMNHRLKKIAIT